MEKQQYELAEKDRQVLLQGMLLYELHLKRNIAEIEKINTLFIGDLQTPKYELLRRFQSELRICSNLIRKLRV